MSIEVLFEDRWLLAADKPSGLLTVPTPKKERRTLTALLNEQVRMEVSGTRLQPCHRLDRDTSGVILYAKSSDVARRMMILFRNHSVRKRYIALVLGVPSKLQGTIREPIEGVNAMTHYSVIERWSLFSMVEAMPVTGRTNQVRIHFASIGHPVLGEDKFAFRRDFTVKAKRLCLHAHRIEFPHPMSGARIMIESAIPAYFEQLLKGYDE